MRHPVSSRRSSIKWNMSSEGGKVIVHSESCSGRTIHQNRFLILDLGREVGKALPISLGTVVRKVQVPVHSDTGPRLSSSSSA